MKDDQTIYDELIEENKENIQEAQIIRNKLLKLNKAHISVDLKLHIIITKYLNRIFEVIPWIKEMFYKGPINYSEFTYFKLIDINTTYNDIFKTIISLIDYDIHFNMKYNSGINNFLKNQ